MIKRVLITGPESCGKTTMASILSQVFNTTYAPEWARVNWDKIGGWDFKIDDLDKVALGQKLYQEEAISKANDIYFSDTSAVETKIYAELHLGTSSETIDKLAFDVRKDFDAVILLAPTVKWVKDDIRNAESNRQEIFEKFLELLKYQIKPDTLLIIDSSDYVERTLYVIDFIERHFYKYKRS